MIEYVEAMRRASRNEIEGVCTSHGKVRYVRELSASMRSLMREVEDESAGFSADGRSRAGGSINSVTNLGAYRQHLEVGAVWALCLCRGVA